MRTGWHIIILYPLRLRGVLSVQDLQDDWMYSYDKQRHLVSRRTWAVIISNALSPVKSRVFQSWFCGEMPLLIPLHLNLLAWWWVAQIEVYRFGSDSGSFPPWFYFNVHFKTMLWFIWQCHAQVSHEGVWCLKPREKLSVLFIQVCGNSVLYVQNSRGQYLFFFSCYMHCLLVLTGILSENPNKRVWKWLYCC